MVLSTPRSRDVYFHNRSTRADLRGRDVFLGIGEEAVPDRRVLEVVQVALILRRSLALGALPHLACRRMVNDSCAW